MAPDGSRWLIPGSFWQLLAIHGSSWQLQAAPCISWQLLGASDSSWQLLATPDSSWQLLPALKHFLTIPDNSWHLSWQLHAAHEVPRKRKILECSGSYTQLTGLRQHARYSSARWIDWSCAKMQIAPRNHRFDDRKLSTYRRPPEVLNGRFRVLCQ